MATRMPVKLPGPTPTRIRSAERPSRSSATIGTSRSAWPRPISSSRWAMQVPEPSNKAAVQAELDVSNARIIKGIVDTCGAKPQPLKSPGAASDRFDGLYFRHIMADQTLDAALESHGRGGAAGAGTVH